MRVRIALILLAIAVVASCESLGTTVAPRPTSPGADAPSATRSSDAIETTRGADYLSDVEKQVIIEMNKVRTDPKAYAANYIEPMRALFHGTILQYPGEIGIQTNEGLSALDECVRVLSSTAPVGVLSPKKGLALAARDQAKDQARTGATGHAGSDGSTMADRLNRYGKWGLSAGENIDYGNSQARRIVISLLIDDGVSSRGHRRNLLSGSFNFIGVAAGPHPVYHAMCVMDFAGAYE